jgi:hypothetical protein
MPLFQRNLSDGRTIDVEPLLFGRARLHIGRTGSMIYDDSW